MNTNRVNALLGTVARNPWSSAQDMLLLCGVMIGAVLLALEYDLLAFAHRLTTPERKLTLEEVIFLTALMVVGVVAFVLRRLREERRDHARAFALDLEIRELRQQATQDPLTDLPNRRAMLAALSEATSGPRCDGHRHAFFLLDLNDFKRVNDRHGHAVGDRVLQIVVERFRAACRPSDMLARLGGDEFAVLSHDVDREAAYAIGQRFMDALASPIQAEGHTHSVGVSVGARNREHAGIALGAVLNVELSGTPLTRPSMLPSAVFAPLPPVTC